jgi:hypothetical protein
MNFYLETSGGQSSDLYLNVVNFFNTSGQYYKPITIINDDSSIINKLETSLIDDARVVIYDRNMFIVQATVLIRHLWLLKQLFSRKSA